MAKSPTSGKGNDNRDLRDSAHDRERMKPEKGSIDLPDVKDIPGQEHINPPRIQEMEDTTISSAGEEGTGVFDETTDDTTNLSYNPNVTRQESETLEDAATNLPTTDDNSLKRSQLEQRDDDGDLLNEKVNLSGSDLDVPGSEEDDENEEIGEEDEENNYYSRADTDQEP